MKKYNEDPIDPGTDPDGNPLGKYKIESDDAIKNEPIKIQCTWANCFTEPTWNRGLCIRSYDRPLLIKNGSPEGIIAATTGNYHIDQDEKIWLEARLNFCNRRSIGWFRESDIWHAKKGTIDPHPETAKKQFNWLAWLTGGAAVLRLFS